MKITEDTLQTLATAAVPLLVLLLFVFLYLIWRELKDVKEAIHDQTCFLTSDSPDDSEDEAGEGWKKNK